MSAINFIYNEQLTWVVDGVNTVFTSANDIDEVESIRIGWAEYTNFSFTGNTVTFAFAPTTALGSPYMDYFVAWITPTPSASQKTFRQIVTEIYEEIGQYETSAQYPLSMVKRYVQETIPLHNNKRVNPLRKIGSYSFNKSKDYVASTYSSTSIDVGSISSYVPASGAILLKNGTFLQYGSRTSTAFQSLSGLSIVYESGDKVDVGYKIPDGVQKISEVFLGRTLLTFKDRREFLIYPGPCYTIIDGYLFLPRTFTDEVVIVGFTYPTTTPINDDDIIDFEPHYEMVLRYDVLKRMYAAREDTRLGVTAELYRDALKDYRSYIARQTDRITGSIPSWDYKYLNSSYYGYTRRY